MQVTPLHIELLVWYHCSTAVFPRADAPAVIEYTNWLLDQHLISGHTSKSGGVYQTTVRGDAWLEMLLTTPLPVQRWLDPRRPA